MTRRCRRCNDKLDVSTFLTGIEKYETRNIKYRTRPVYWCDNKHCELYGILTLAYHKEES